MISPYVPMLLVFLLLLGGCAQTSPSQEVAVAPSSDGVSAQMIFDSTFARHGGEQLASLTDVNVSVDGDWHFLITKIQPLVTDDEYRQQSEERVLRAERTYAALYTGSAGSKRVRRTASAIDVAYDGTVNTNSRTEAATALTADAFYLFVLGPLALADRVQRWQRLEDGEWQGRDYYRINGELTPGIGLSDSDYITLWVDKQTKLTFRVHITLEGFESTKGAHVDTTFLAYTQAGPFTFATHFFERVLGPIKLDAHEWWYTGLDINRGLRPEDLTIDGWSEKAARAATPIDNPAAR